MFVRFFNTSIPVSRCNLNCHYCYIGHTGGFLDRDETLHYSMKHIKNALHPKRLGGVCMFNLCAAGETTLFNELHELTELLLGLGHYVTIVTNCSLSEPICKITELPNKLTERLFIKCSFPYLELKERGLIETYFYNIGVIKSRKIAFSVELTANDEAIPYICEIKDVCMKYMGALCHIIESRDESNLNFHRLTKLPIEKHQSAWSVFESPLFEYQQKNWGISQSDNFCYAGEYRLTLNIQTGDVYQCCGMKKLFNLFENPTESIYYAAVGTNCIYGHCYAAHYQSCLCGCLSEANTPTYAQERDRVCLDGTSWLTPVMRETFSYRCSEYHNPYSDEKAFYINMLMAKVYKGTETSKQEMQRLSHVIAEVLHSKKIKKIALYGYGILGKWLLDILKYTGIEVACIIDRRFQEIQCHLPVLSPDCPLPELDAVIVSVYTDFTNIAPALRKKTTKPILSLTGLLDS